MNALIPIASYINGRKRDARGSSTKPNLEADPGFISAVKDICDLSRNILKTVDARGALDLVQLVEFIVQGSVDSISRNLNSERQTGIVLTF